jgi:iron complex transport system substrate-binding protein
LKCVGLLQRLRSPAHQARTQNHAASSASIIAPINSCSRSLTARKSPLSLLARNATILISAVARADMRQTRGTLEEVLALRPDLVIRNWGGSWDAEQVYGRFDIPVLQVGDTPDFVTARADLLDAAQTLGHPERGQSLAADLDARLARLATQRSNAPVMYLSGGGAVAGRSTMMDAIISAAGGRNIRTEASWQVLPLERLVQTPPALIALGFFDTSRDRVNAWSPSRHPALRRALNATRTIHLPPATISCEAWYAIDAAEAIAAALNAS